MPLRATSLNVHPISQKAECAKNRASCRGGSISKLDSRPYFFPHVALVKVEEDSRQAFVAFYLRAK